jgi:enoyl-CoA hydratase/carnithine racemase
MLGDKVAPERALEIGLASEVVDDGALRMKSHGEFYSAWSEGRNPEWVGR